MMENTPSNPDFGPEIGNELGRPASNELGPGEPPREKARIEARKLFAHTEIEDAEAAELCAAALLLRRDALDASHDISARYKSWEAAWWHGIMHRREPDASNAKYWFRNVGDAPLFDALARRVREETEVPDEASGVVKDGWDPFAFIDACERARDTGSDLEEWCKRAQAIEWELLFEHTYRRATRG